MPGKKILIVDDEEAIRNTLLDMVTLLGASAEDADSGARALEILEENPREYGIVFLDVFMQGMDGIETLVRLRKLNPDIPVYIVSGYDASEMEDEVRNKGANGILSKPFRLVDLQKIIEEYTC